MGIYLPKMEMPRKGQMLVIFPDGTSYVCFNGMRERIAQTEAVPVPPQGRLGDLDELYKEVKDMAKEFPPDSIGAERYRLFAEFIKTAPTVIPASE